MSSGTLTRCSQGTLRCSRRPTREAVGDVRGIARRCGVVVEILGEISGVVDGRRLEVLR